VSSGSPKDVADKLTFAMHARSRGNPRTNLDGGRPVGVQDRHTSWVDTDADKEAWLVRLPYTRRFCLTAGDRTVRGMRRWWDPRGGGAI